MANNIADSTGCVNKTPNQQVDLTKFTSKSPLSKRFDLVDGAIKKTPAAQMGYGRSEKVSIPFTELPSFFASLTAYQCTGYGAHDVVQFGTIVPIQTARKANPPKSIARTKQFFSYQSASGVLMIDHDPSPYVPAVSHEKLIEILISIHPAIADAAYFSRGSVSSGIHALGKDAPPQTSKGFHLYFTVANASDIPRYGLTLFKRLWLGGHGEIALSAVGSMLERCLIDAAVFSPERLDFTGRPICGEGVGWTPPSIEYHDGGYLDTATLAGLTEAEEAEYQALVAAAKLEKEPEAAAKGRKWFDAKVSEMVERGVNRTEAGKQIAKFINGNYQDLPTDLHLQFATMGAATVAEVLRAPRQFDGQALADPIEGPEYGTTTAVFYANLGKGNEKPFINSFAHGGAKYFLKAVSPVKATILADGNDDDDVTEEEIVAFNNRDEPGNNIYRGTDDGNAELFLSIHGKDVKYCPTWEKWLIWQEGHWAIDERLEIQQLTLDVPRKLLEDASKTKKQEKRAWLRELSRKLEGAGKRNNMLSVLKPRVVVHHSELDKKHYLLNVKNGTVDLQTGKLYRHAREDLLTHFLDIDFNKDKRSTLWEKFLRDVFQNDEELIAFIQKAVGYSLTGDVREQCLFIAHGCGSNGKSVFLNILQKLLANLSIQAATDLLMASKSDKHPTEQADLFGKRLVVCQETEEGRRFKESLLKQLTGGDLIRARRMREDFWQFEPTHKIWLSTNHKPEIRGTDHAIWRRIRLIPFDVKFTDDGVNRKDPAMEEKLTQQLDGILAWAVEGCLRWQREGLRAPEAVRNATNSYQNEMDVLGAWINECCVVGNRYEAFADDLYLSYKNWSENSGEYAKKQRDFGMRLTEKGFFRERGTGGRHKWVGIGLSSDRSDPSDPGFRYNRAETSSRGCYTEKSVTSVTSVTPTKETKESSERVTFPDIDPSDVEIF